MAKNSGLGRGLSSLIPQKDDEKVIAPPADGEVKEPGTVLEVPIERVCHNPRQPRKEFVTEDLHDLVSSIGKHGILQPLVVSVREDGEYELIAGERRLRAAKELGLERVPIVSRTVNDQEKLELALIENIQRQDLNAVEEAMAYKALRDEFGLTQKQIADQVGKSRSAVTNTMRLLELSSDMQEALAGGKISRSHARSLLSEEDEKKRRELFEKILGGGVTVRQVEARAGSAKRARKKTGQDPNLVALETELEQSLGTKVKIQEREGRGKVILDFYSKEDLRKLIEKFRG